MKVICCFPNCAYRSETSRMIAVYKSLIARGENAIVATHGGTYEYILRDEGIHPDPSLLKNLSRAYPAPVLTEIGCPV